MAQNSSIWAKFPPKNPAKSAVFFFFFLAEVSPRNFLWHRPIFLTICPWKSFEIWLFSAKIPRNRPIFLRILTFLPRKSRKISRFLREFWLFSRENPAKISRFFREFPLENPTKFCFVFREISEALLIDTTSSAPLITPALLYCLQPKSFTLTFFQA